MIRRHLMAVVAGTALLGIAGEALAQATLRKGSQGAEVRRLQELLRSRSFNVTVDGRFGTTTEKAVKEWQRARSLRADGVVGPTTWATLSAPERPPARPSQTADRKLELKTPRMTGADVRDVQRLLIRAGFNLGVDGRYGPGTVAAVREFQRQRRLNPDGKVGPDTWSALRG